MPQLTDLSTMAISEQLVTQTPATIFQLPPSSVLTAAQWDVLRALVETVIPSISSQDATNDGNSLQSQASEYASARDAITASGIVDGDSATQYLAESPIADAGFKEALTRLLFHGIDGEQRKKLFLVLSLLK